MTIKVVADDAIPFIARFFSAVADVELVPAREIDSNSLRQADVLVCRTVTRIDEELLAGTPVKIVASPTSGIDHVDQHYLAANDIAPVNAPGCNAKSVAEYVLSALFVLAEKDGFDIARKCVGIVGCGHVGSRLMNYLAALEIDYRVCDPFLQQHSDSGNFCDLEEICNCDIISLHVPLTDDGPHPTRNLLDESFFASVSDELILLNTSRGGVIDESALKAFLQARENAAAVVDVWQGEPSIDLELLQAADIATPHIAGYSMDGKYAATRKVFKEVCEFFELAFADDEISEVFPDQDLQLIKLGRDQDDLDEISLAVLASYDVRSDAAALRRMLEDSVVDKADYFADLRNNYPIRREYSATAIRLENESEKLREKLLKLGFHILD